MAGGLKALVLDALAGALWRTRRSRPERTGRGALTIVTFHRVLPPADRADYPYPGLAVTPEGLDAALGYLTEHYTVGTVTESWAALTAGVPAPRPRLSVTFDDGQWDNLAHAAPVLASHGVQATFYVPVDAVQDGTLLWHDQVGYARQHLERAGRGSELAALASQHGLAVADLTEAAKVLSPAQRSELVTSLATLDPSPAPSWGRLMTWDEVRALHAAGHEIGSHSLSHALLPQLGDAELGGELAGSKEVLEREVGAPVTSFCYPNGDHDRRVRDATEAAGYANAVTTRWGRNPVGADGFTLARCDMDLRRFHDRHDRFSASRTAMRIGGLQPGLP